MAVRFGHREVTDLLTTHIVGINLEGSLIDSRLGIFRGNEVLAKSVYEYSWRALETSYENHNCVPWLPIGYIHATWPQSVLLVSVFSRG